MFSVVVLSHNRHEPLLKMLASLPRGHVDGEAIEILVVDSSDESIEVPADVRVVKSPTGCRVSHKINFGIRASQGDRFILLPDDGWMYPGSIEQALRLSKRFPEKSMGAYFMNAFMETGQELCVCNTEICSLVMRQDEFQSLGGFDERFHFKFIDAEIMHRMYDRGYTLQVIVGCCLVHEPKSDGTRSAGMSYAEADQQLYESLFPQRQTHPTLIFCPIHNPNPEGLGAVSAKDMLYVPTTPHGHLKEVQYV